MTLRINTTQPTVEVALVDGKKIMASKQWSNTSALGQELLPAIEAMLVECSSARTDVQDIEVYTGPGHFGALRQGIVAASMLALALEVPIHGIDAAGQRTAVVAPLYQAA